MTVTARARWIIFVATVAALIGLARQDALVVRMAMACLIWIGMEWILFRYRVDVVLQGARITREVRDRQSIARVLWESRSAGVMTTLRFPATVASWLPAIRATVHDLLPTGAEILAGDNGQTFWLGPASQVAICYRIRPHSPGAIRFTGLRFVVQDLHGFFQAERYLPAAAHFRVLPLAMDFGTLSAVRKHHNLLSPPGVHLMSKAGVGSELMEIRDYVPGDPPRSIAWKVSARRDVLMSKQFESEVPVRCQLLVDMSRSVRLGFPGPCLGSRLVSLSAAIAYTVSSQRDPVGVCVFDGNHVDISRSSANRKSVLHMVDKISESLERPLEPVASEPSEMIRSAYDLARVRYPEAVDYARRSLAGFWPTRRSWGIRLRISAILCNHYGLDQLAMGELVDNDATLSYWLQRFHADHGAPYSGSLFDAEGRYLFDDGGKIEQIAKLIRRATVRGRDNELFVVMAELIDAEYDLTPLVQAIKFASARHHRVVVLAAWPVKMPLPKSLISLDHLLEEPSPTTAYLLERRQKENAFFRLRAELGKLRVPVVAAADEMATTLVLNQLEIVRSGRARA